MALQPPIPSLSCNRDVVGIPSLPPFAGVLPDAAFRGKYLAAAPKQPVVAATRRDLAVLKRRDEALADGSLAQAALALAARIDDPKNSATSVSMCAARLLDLMDRLWQLAPADVERNRVDELHAKREKRLAG